MRILKISDDITARQQADDERDRLTKRLLLAIAIAEMGVWEWQLDSNTLVWDSVMFDMYGLARAESITYADWAKAVHPADLPIREAILRQTVASKGQNACEFRIVLKDGSVRIISAAERVVLDEKGDVVRVVGVNTDVTTRKTIEAELRSAKDAAESANRAKSEYLAKMSREIRTPTNVIVGMADLLTEIELPPEQKEYVTSIQKSSKTLLALLSDIVDISKVEAGQIFLTDVPFRLDELLEHTVALISPRAQQKKLKLRMNVSGEIPMNLTGDPARLGQVLLNLLSNAVKFTQVGEVDVRVESEVDAAIGSMLRFSVSDTGIGISPKIFQRFREGDGSTARDDGGPGAGLTISKQLIELMGGILSVQSTVGKGSTFSFCIPLRVADYRTIDQVGAESDISGLKALIVSGDAAERLFIKGVLEQQLTQTAEAENLAGAIVELERAKQAEEPYGVVLWDSVTSGAGGEECNRWWPEQLSREWASVLMVESGEPDGELRARELNMDSCSVKPVRKVSLTAAILEAVKAKLTFEATSLKSVRATPESRLRILVVDDSEDNRILIKAYIAASHQVDTAENGAIAVEKFKSSQYDLIIMDVQMPVLDGYSATRQIRLWERAKRLTPIPVLSLTAYSDEGEGLKAKDAGCSVHLSKPIAKSELMIAISDHTRPMSQVLGISDEIAALAPAFLARQRVKFQALFNPLIDRDYIAIERFGHHLKGSGRGYGYPQLSDLGRAIEDAAKAHNADDMGKYTTVLEEVLEVQN